MTYTEMETYLCVAETRKLNKAAEMLFVSQSTITHRLQKLEEELGYTLFLRQKGKRTIALTERGEEFILIAERFIDLYHEMELLKKNDITKLSIASVNSVVTTILPQIYKNSRMYLEDFRLQMTSMYSDEIYLQVKNRNADIGFVTIDHGDPELEIEEVFRQQYVVIRRCENPVDIQKINPRDLDISKEIYTSWGSEFQKWHHRMWPGGLPLINVDTITCVKEYLNNEDHWSIVHMSGYHYLKKFVSIQAYELMDGPSDWVCYRIRHKHPNRQRISAINTFDKILKKFIQETFLFDAI